MAAYVAVARFRDMMANVKTYFGMILPPLYLEIVELLIKELSWIQESIERMDLRGRMKMKASLEQIPELIEEYKAVFTEYAQAEEHASAGEDFKEHTLSFLERLKKLVDDEEFRDDRPNFQVSSRPKMVGLSDEFTKLKLHLVDDANLHDLPLYFFSLVGTAGIGKTTLAKEIFQDLDMLEWFDCHVWVKVGKKYQPEELFRSILAQVDPDAHEMHTRGFQEIVEYLKESFKDKRYLIVLDDVWDIKLIQDHFESLFPDNEFGSRVLLTSRTQPQANDESFANHHLRLLNKEESWHLLCEKVFVDGTCPPELEKVGKKIAEKCEGLPLTIITVVDLLSKAEKTESFWTEVAERKRHRVFIDAYKEISKVLYPSYEDLNEDLKLCFLYIGVFPHNNKIPKSKLINLWIVEKIIKKGSFQTLEISGVECLEYLDLRSLIMVYERSTISNPTERIKTCGLHASWWHFCYNEAEEKNFFHVLDSCSDASREAMKNQVRLTIHNNILFGIKDVCKSMEENCASTTHSLLCLGPYHQYQVPICFSLRLLQKLDALNIRFYQFPLEVLELIKLKYLALTCNTNLPSSISKLGKLRYLIVHRHLHIKYFGPPSYLPIEIWDMTKLKHLHVIGSDVRVPNVGEISFLPNLLTLSGVSLDSCTIGVFKRIPKLKKLGIRIQLMPNVIETMNCFDHISDLGELESLKYVVENPTFKSEVVAPVIPLPIFALNLQKLYLNGLGYPWREMTKISSLPNLQVLKLRCNAFQGPKWEIEADEFPKLSSLLIEDIDLVELKGTDESFECLRKVSIKHCYNMKWLYLRRETVSTIEIVDCNPLFQKQIQESLLEETTTAPKHFLMKSSWDS